MDDPHWLLTMLTRDSQGSKQPVCIVTRESAHVSVFWDGVMGHPGFVRPLCKGFILPVMASKTDASYLLRWACDLYL